MHSSDMSRVFLLCRKALNSEIPNEEALIRIHEIVRYYVDRGVCKDE